MIRRIVVCLLATTLLPAVFSSQAQSKTARIGLLIAGTQATMKSRIDAFRQRLQELGWVEGKNIAFEYRYAEGKLENLTAAAVELVGLKVDLVVAASVGVQAAKKATNTIPIVMMGFGDDPVIAGLIVSFAKPAGNVTGMISQELTGKRLELFKEAFPRFSQVAAFWNPDAREPDFKELESTAQSFKVQIRSIEIRKHNDIDSAFAAMAKNRPDALFVVSDPVINSGRRKVIVLAATNKIPTMCPDTRWVNDGGLMAYSQDLEDQARRSATYVDKILKGAKPADLPVEKPRKFEFIINLKTAKQIGLTIPPNVLARADRVIK